jgi:NADH-quinone oxidoreductase subunit M
MLSILIFLPVVGAILLAMLPAEGVETIKRAAFGVALLNFVLSLFLLPGFNAAQDDRFQFVERVEWIPQLGIHYYLGVDGIGLVLLLLTTLLSAIAILSSWTAVERRVREYFIFLLLLETGMIGVFCALDLILFYVFWEAMLIPMYFLIGVWGGPRRVYATIKFVLYTMVGSLLMLVAIITLYLRQGTFDLTQIETALLTQPIPLQVQLLMFGAFGLAFAIKVPMFPFHTWLPDAHVEAPTAGSVILAGVLLKMGTYGFLRFCLPLFPEASRLAAPYILMLAVVGIIYGALVALPQRDIKKLVAYSSVSHLGFVMLGMFALTSQGMQGSILQMINHGLSTGALFLIVGMIYERRHTREIADFGGLWHVIPIFAIFFAITMFSSIGLPGLNGFVGEFLTLLGSFGPYPVLSALGATGVILGAIYMLWMFQRVMQGPLDKPENQSLRDLTPREWSVLVPLVLLMFAIGIMPNPFLNLFDQSSERILGRVRVASRPALDLSRHAAGRPVLRARRSAADGRRSPASRLPLGPTKAPASRLAWRLAPTLAERREGGDRRPPSAERSDRREP